MLERLGRGLYPGPFAIPGFRLLGFIGDSVGGDGIGGRRKGPKRNFERDHKKGAEWKFSPDKIQNPIN